MSDMDIGDIFIHHKKIHDNIESALLLDATTAGKKLDIFTVLQHSDQQDYDYYNKWSDQGIKEFSPWVIQRWLASKKLELVNEITNPLISGVSKQLAWRLFCAIGSGTVIRYTWNTPPKKIAGKDTIIMLVAQHYDVSTRVARTYLTNLSNSQILEIAELENVDKVDLKKLKKLLK